MARPRPIFPNTFSFSTRRCTQRQFLLRPDAETNNAFVYCLAEAVRGAGDLVAEREYRQARKLLLAGSAVEFPSGTYWLKRFANVRFSCASCARAVAAWMTACAAASHRRASRRRLR